MTPNLRVSRVKIRPAKAEDKGPVLDICRNTWGGHDYIPEVWDEWLRDRNARVVVATVRGEPVGVAHAYFQTGDVAWLEGVRVHARFRGQGIAGKLNRALVRFAAQKGARLARLCTGIDNIASKRHIKKLTGFKLLQSFKRLDSTRALVRRPPEVTRPRKFQPSLWKWVERSRHYNDFRGLFSDGWTYYPLTSTSFRRSIVERRVLIVTKDGRPSSCGIVSAGDRRLLLGFVTGDSEGVETQARYLRYMLRHGLYNRARAIVPQRSSLEDILEDAGYEQTASILVYEKSLHSSR